MEIQLVSPRQRVESSWFLPGLRLCLCLLIFSSGVLLVLLEEAETAGPGRTTTSRNEHRNGRATNHKSVMRLSESGISVATNSTRHDKPSRFKGLLYLAICIEPHLSLPYQFVTLMTFSTFTIPVYHHKPTPHQNDHLLSTLLKPSCIVQ